MSEHSERETKKTSAKSKKESIEKKLLQLQQEYDKMKEELKATNDRFLRSLADVQNLHKRYEKELQQREEEVKKKYLLELVDLHELLQKAYEDKDPKAGLKLLLQNLEHFLEQENITYIDCIGKQFDHTLHHAITTIEKDECEENTVVDEIKKGYIVNEKLLRPAHVVVAKKKDTNKQNG
jgi:molecular chaperone GrpE